MTDRLLSDADLFDIDIADATLGDRHYDVLLSPVELHRRKLISHARALKAERDAALAKLSTLQKIDVVGKCAYDAAIVSNAALQHDNARLVAQATQRDIDIGILLASIKYMEEATGEPPDDPMVGQIRDEHEARQAAAKPGDGK